MIKDAGLPAEIVVKVTARGIHYRLPPHGLGSFRWVGLLVMAFGLAPIGMAVGFVAFTMKIADKNPAFLISLLFSLTVLLFFLGFAGIFLFFGAWILAGHSEIELTPKQIRAIRGVGPFYWSRPRPRALVRQFTVVHPVAGGVQLGAVALQTAWPKLQAECVGTKPLLLAVGYQGDLLRALAQELSRRTAPPPRNTLRNVRQCKVSPFVAPALPPEPIRVAVETDNPAVANDRPLQPPESSALLETYPDGVTITIPATVCGTVQTVSSSCGRGAGASCCCP